MKTLEPITKDTLKQLLFIFEHILLHSCSQREAECWVQVGNQHATAACLQLPFSPSLIPSFTVMNASLRSMTPKVTGTEQQSTASAPCDTFPTHAGNNSITHSYSQTLSSHLSPCSNLRCNQTGFNAVFSSWSVF